jgi:hypothetical protein
LGELRTSAALGIICAVSTTCEGREILDIPGRRPSANITPPFLPYTLREFLLKSAIIMDENI